MELPTFDWSREAVALDAFERDVARRREAAGTIAMPRNSGARRTDSKRALLAALDQTGARW
jgi:hypothetical protein